MARTESALFPALLRHWRTRRGLSQLDLAVAAEVSSRHVSFLETGRSQPTRDMALRLCVTLDVPLRDQNDVLRAAGFKPQYPESDVGGALPASIERAVERIFARHDPFPIALLDRRYDAVRVNEAGMRLLSRVVAEPAALGPRPNSFTLMFDPRMIRSFVVNWEDVARPMVARLHRETLLRPNDPERSELLRSLFEYPGVPSSWRHPDFGQPDEPVLSFRLHRGDLELAFLTTVTSFNAPQNVTVEELRIESYFPLDEATERACERLRK
jgi:transcriptional regulator with XRE-family HTH domain